MTLDDFSKIRKQRAPTASEVVALIDHMGWTIAYGEDGQPRIRCNSRQDPLAIQLAKMLKREPYRSNTLKAAAARWNLQRPENAQDVGREWLWRFGHTYRETPDDSHLWGNMDRHPVGAWWWRMVGETQWHPIPGRCDCTPEEYKQREAQGDTRGICSEVPGQVAPVHHGSVGSEGPATEYAGADTGSALYRSEEVTGRYLGGF